MNLSPYEKDRIIPQSFGLTEMGRDLLAEDYVLKQVTASLIYPEETIGKKFWKRVYTDAVKRYGTTNVPVNTFNKVWIVPEKAVVYENAKAGTAYIVESRLKVMLEQDYLSLAKHQGLQTNQSQALVSTGSQIVRDIVIPQLNQEVNTNKNFAHLRQVYNSLILATWYKKKIKDSLLSEVYADKNKTAGIQYSNSLIPKKDSVLYKNDVEGLYKEYLKAFKKGAFNYIKEEIDPATQAEIPRKYFSGGMGFDGAQLAKAETFITDLAMVFKFFKDLFLKERVVDVEIKETNSEGDKNAQDQEIKPKLNPKIEGMAEAFEKIKARLVTYNEKLVDELPLVQNHGTSSALVWKMILEEDVHFHTQGFLTPQPTNNKNAIGARLIFLSTERQEEYAQEAVSKHGGQKIFLTFNFQTLTSHGIRVEPGTHSAKEHPITHKKINYFSWHGYNTVSDPISLKLLTDESKQHLISALAIDMSEGLKMTDEELLRISNALDVATISRAMLSRRNLALMHRTAVLKVISLVVLSSLTQGCAGLSERSTASEDFAYFLGTNTMQSPNVNNNLNDALSNPRPFEGIFSAVGLTVLHQTTQEVRNLLQRKLPREENNPEDDLEKPPPVDPAMANKGGIDLTPARMNLRTSADGTAIVFHIDPAQLARWQKAPGFEPEIISMRQLDSVAEFLGIAVGHG